MMQVGQELMLGEWAGYLQVFDIENLVITNTQQFEETGLICDMIPIENSEQLLLAGWKGLLKATTKGQAIKNYFQGKGVESICHIAESFYLVGSSYRFIVWNEHSDQELFQICQDRVFSIKRILTTNTYIIKTQKYGLKLFTIKNFK